MTDEGRTGEAEVAVSGDWTVVETERVLEYEALGADEAVVAEAVVADPIAGEVTVHRFRLAPEIAARFPAEVVRTAEFWLNVADGDLAVALSLASERLNLAAATASRGFLRGRQLNTATGF